ncbi:DUF169 domain-containing protein [Sedimenticola hydrogenitrophicus]|uniref:DUF169 domain-containing protein n=1 Tax=Sedimenticola hydrogenitrophicus TaxID=2967975 RepID=UPI0021A8A600|nr:DUF169 domain-containing protein [Sedimenticola hydrogenitrophicus]
MSQQTNQQLAEELTSALALQHQPLAISFTQAPVPGVEPFAEAIPEPTEDGRSGRVPAGCVFWMKAAERTFSTVAEDHGNCSVGSVTHGFKTLEEVGNLSDVGALVGAGWVAPEMFPQIPVVTERFRYVTYGPLKDSPRLPDVVFLRINAKQAMTLSDAIPGLRFEGKPQCHIVAIAKEQEMVAVSVGCMLSRVRTGLPNSEMTCAIPGSRLAEVTQMIKTTAVIDGTVANYASEDSRRFRL